ncbi:hypothetical protein QBC45DRAFT_229404 [Copromyces sp. CBS 386.78]|nr:hypothetical protein QBC45DRAFT_229404 [Copromyces sp. CBS 386.78]
MVCWEEGTVSRAVHTQQPDWKHLPQSAKMEVALSCGIRFPLEIHLLHTIKPPNFPFSHLLIFLSPSRFSYLIHLSLVYLPRFINHHHLWNHYITMFHYCRDEDPAETNGTAPAPDAAAHAIEEASESDGSNPPSYDVARWESNRDRAINQFFASTSATHEDCHAKAKELFGGTEVVPAGRQEPFLYTVYGGPEFEYTVSFWSDSHSLSSEFFEISSLASHIYGSLVPKVSSKGMLGEGGGKPAVHVYFTDNQMPGVLYHAYMMDHREEEDSPDTLLRRENLMGDIGRFMALSWKAPQLVKSSHREDIRARYAADLNRFNTLLPSRFRPTSLLLGTFRVMPRRAYACWSNASNFGSGHSAQTIHTRYLAPQRCVNGRNQWVSHGH